MPFISTVSYRHGPLHHMAIDILDHARNLAFPECVEMGEGSLHRTPGGLEGAGIHAEGGDLVTLLEVMAGLGAIVDPFGRQPLKHIGDDCLRADIGACVGKAGRFNPLGVRREHGKESSHVFAGGAFVG